MSNPSKSEVDKRRSRLYSVAVAARSAREDARIAFARARQAVETADSRITLAGARVDEAAMRGDVASFDMARAATRDASAIASAVQKELEGAAIAAEELRRLGRQLTDSPFTSLMRRGWRFAETELQGFALIAGAAVEVAGRIAQIGALAALWISLAPFATGLDLAGVYIADNWRALTDVPRGLIGMGSGAFDVLVFAAASMAFMALAHGGHFVNAYQRLQYDDAYGLGAFAQRVGAVVAAGVGAQVLISIALTFGVLIIAKVAGV